ncbi:MAG: peptidoglycan DD-metalloendopeptidase family protein [Pseudomonadota bacterium]|nr:peptidoglycan DD-metalloendopeptidase family protein [Pseudomonadota bacterium]
MAFHPVVVLPPGYTVLDLSRPWPGPSDAPAGPGPDAPVWTVGRYDEDRVIYTQPLFEGGRTLHVGIDLGGPEGTAVHAFGEGEVIHAGVNPAAGDYGPTLVTAHVFEGRPLYALFGHLAAASLARSPVRRRFRAGDVLGWLGAEHENGGWPPHVHVQLAWERPVTHDLPGAVRPADRADALRRYPDPRRVLGPLY